MSSQFQRLTKILARSFKLDENTLLENFCLASVEDIPTVSALRRKVFGDIIKLDDESYLAWRYFGRSEFPSTLWLFKYNHQIIAALGTEPVEIWYQGKIEPALRNMDAIVEPKYDSRGLGAWMTLAIQNQHDCVLVNGGNENSTSMLKKLFTALPAQKNYKIIFNARKFLNQKLPGSHFTGMLTPVFNFAAILYLRFLWASKSVPKDLTLSYFDDIGQLLDYVVDPVGCIAEIKVVRTKAYLKWRYADNPSQHYYAVGLFNQKKMVAYVIYKFDDDWGHGNTRMGQIVDWYVNQTGNNLRILASLFIMAIKDMRIRGSDEVMIVLNDDLSRRVATATGFIFRYVESTFFVYYA